MITPQAQHSFDALLMKAMAENLVITPGDGCRIETIPANERVEESEFVVLTISSYLFRLVVLFHFTATPETRDHFARLLRLPGKGLDDKAFYDAVSEFGNLCCGALNRDLGQSFPHVGMSTPNLLKRGSMRFLATLEAGYTQVFRIEFSETLRFHATICVCEYGDLDFRWEPKALAETSGELELF